MFTTNSESHSGTDTTATILEWAVVYLCLYPDIQDRLHDAICRVIDGSEVTLSDRPALGLVDAFNEEVNRHSPEGVMGSVPHKTMEDAWLGGHFIPRGTQVRGDEGQSNSLECQLRIDVAATLSPEPAKAACTLSENPSTISR